MFFSRDNSFFFNVTCSRMFVVLTDKISIRHWKRNTTELIIPPLFHLLNCFSAIFFSKIKNFDAHYSTEKETLIIHCT